MDYVQDYLYGTPLHLAAKYGHLIVCKSVTDQIKDKKFVKLFWKYLRIYSLNNLIMSKNSLHPATKCGNLNITKSVIHKMKNNNPTTLETSWDLITNLAEVEILIFDWFQRIESIPKTNVE